MKLGLFTSVYGALSLDAMLSNVSMLGIEQLELGSGAWPGNPHLPVNDLLGNSVAAGEFLSKLADHGCSISALSCHGNPLHPVSGIAAEFDAIFRRTVRLAAKLNVQTVVTFSGCPGDQGQSRVPNWVTTPWPPEYAELLEWQWEAVAVPYWRDVVKFASSHGVRIGIEAHPGFLVYNVETLKRLRSSTSDALGINFDPSHLYWQGVHMPTAIGALGDAIFHVHAKDVAMSRQTVDTNGVLDTKSYTRVNERSWNFRTIGFGHGEQDWREILSALRIAGYDGVVSIEHEDSLVSIDEGVAMAVNLLKRILLRQPPAEAWWIKASCRD
jgi:sugar phosphate isomerase/epimerase